MPNILQNHCIQQLIYAINEGRSTKNDYEHITKLDKVVSKIFPFSKERMVELLGPKLSLSNVIVDQPRLNEQHVRMFHSQDEILSLDLTHVHFQEMFRFWSTIPDTDEEMYTVDINDVLEMLLNENSRRTLNRLAISGWNISHGDDWIPQMRQMLPALTSLHLEVDVIDQYGFSLICQNLSHLKSLAIARQSMTSLAGISNIEKLECLKLLDLQFNEAHAFMDLFSLQHLRNLILAADSYSITKLQAMKQLMQCERSISCQKKVFPALTFLDCSDNDISVEEVTRFANSHPLLNEICVMCTEMEKTVELPTMNRKRVELISTGSLENCLRSLRYHGEADVGLQALKSEITLKEILTILENRYDDQPQKEKQMCFELVLRRLNNLDLEVNYYSVQILDLLCRGTRLQHLSNNIILDTFTNLILNDQTEHWSDRNYHTQREYNVRCKETRNITWGLLNTISLLELSADNAELLFSKTTSQLECWSRSNRFETFNCSAVVTVLRNCLQKFSKPFQSTWTLENFLGAIENILSKDVDTLTFLDLMRLGFQSIGKCAHVSNCVTYDFILAIGKNLHKLSDYDWKIEAMRNIEEVVMKFDLSFFQNATPLDIVNRKIYLLDYLRFIFRNTQVQRATISLCFTLIHFWEGLEVLPIDDIKRVRDSHVDRIVELLRTSNRRLTPTQLQQKIGEVRTFKLMKWAKKTLIHWYNPSYSVELETLKLSQLNEISQANNHGLDAQWRSLCSNSWIE